MTAVRPLIIAVSKSGAALAARLAAPLAADTCLSARAAPPGYGGRTYAAAVDLRQALAAAFAAAQPLVLVMPVGAAVRLIAPHLRSKHSDPPVVAVDDDGRFAIPLASSHEGGANELATRVAGILGAQAVVTTAAEATGTLALDVLAREQAWKLEPGSDLTHVTALLVEGAPVAGYQDAGDESWWAYAPPNLQRLSVLPSAAPPATAELLAITDRVITLPSGIRTALFRPPTLAVGVGCVRGATADEMDALLCQTLAETGLSPLSVAAIATIDMKRDEAGIGELATRYGVPVHYYPAADLTAAPGPSDPSTAALAAVGAPGVCEPAALLAANGGPLLAVKHKTPRVTVAVARIAPQRRGSLALVGLGPADAEGLTEQARQALQASDTVVGYSLYLDFVRPWLGLRDYRAHPIGEEVERCREAVDLAREGRRVALVCSGDAGIYGMAGLVLEIYAAEGAAAEADALTVIPGVSAAQSAAALLGAPLMSDFATISLSDLMTPWATIRARLQAVAAADLVVALYNPASARRRRQLAEAVDILLAHRPPDTLAGTVRDAGRPGQQVAVTDLGHLLEHPIDMLTTLIIGNSMTQRIGNRIFTRRGYTTG